ncbi:response regulator [Kordiimonas lipolytica]|uniref:Response regulator n=1 Tax=Kordiimonas lipolytica TaxID=1662421 RepID=A0ABV8U7K1_9PROT|nr:response regulator [Kordiimonas lipolytica]
MQDDTKKTSPITEKTSTAEIAMPDVGGARILVVEDNPVMGQIIEKLLAAFSVQHDRVCDGLQAIEAAREHDYALILMDILMPKMGGVRATKEIRKLSPHYKNLPIIAVTAKVSERDIDQYLSEGMSGVVKKPINRLNLATVMKEHLGISEQQENAGTDDSEETFYQGDELDILNWETLNEYRAILKDKFKHFLKDYLVAGPDLLAAVGQAIEAGDAEGVQFHAHKFKSTSQVFGAEAVSDLAAKLEIMGKKGDIAGALPTFHELHIAFERAQHALRKKLVLLQNM